MFVTKTAQFPARVQSCQKVKDLLIEKRVSDLHGRVHRHPITFSLKEVPSQSDPSCDPDTTVQRVPPFGALQGHLQIVPRIKFLQNFSHRRSVEPKLREPEQTVSIDPGVGTTNRVLHTASKVARLLWDTAQPKISATCVIAER